MKQHIPNLITLSNLFCGCCAIVLILQQRFIEGAYFIAGGAVADYLDGTIARLLGAKSELGKQLDSLADVVTFGVVQGIIIYTLLSLSPNVNAYLNIAALPAFLLPMAAAFRLGRFNIDIRQTEDFIGLNTPATTIFMVGLMLTYHYDSYGLRSFITQPWLLYSIVVAFSFFMNMELPMFGFKFKHLRWRSNEYRLLFLILALISLLILGTFGLCVAIMLYLVLSMLYNTRKSA